MVKIRLTRTGRKGDPHYRVIVTQAREKRDSRAIEQIGYYNPQTQPSTFEIDKERAEYWLSVGAQPTATVARFLAKEGLYEAEDKKFNKKPGRKAQERKAEEEEAAAKEKETKEETK